MTSQHCLLSSYRQMSKYLETKVYHRYILGFVGSLLSTVTAFNWKHTLYLSQCTPLKKVHWNLLHFTFNWHWSILQSHFNFIWLGCLVLKGRPTKINVGFKCSFFLEDKDGTIYLGVKHMLTELLQPKVGTIWCIYAIWLCTRTLTSP